MNPVRRQATHLRLCVTDGVFSRDPHGTLRELAAVHQALALLARRRGGEDRSFSEFAPHAIRADPEHVQLSGRDRVKHR